MSDTLSSTPHSSVKFEVVERVLGRHAPEIIACVVGVCAELVRVLESVVRVLSMLLIRSVSVEVIRLSLVLSTLLNVDALSTLESLIIELRQQLTNRVLLALVMVQDVRVTALLIAAMVAILKLAVPQSLNLIDLLGAEFAPLFILVLLIFILRISVALILPFLSQVS